MYMQCRHIMPNGARCHSPALREKAYCYYHFRFHDLSKPAKSAAGKKSLKLPFIEDRSSILAAVSQIIDALGTGKIEIKQAQSFLYALQVATPNVERKQDVLPFVSVRKMVRTRNGEDLATPLRICEPKDMCTGCELSDTCQDYHPEQDKDRQQRT